jgi:leucyl aminopeptidase (aminopeptidase T)
MTRSPVTVALAALAAALSLAAPPPAAAEGPGSSQLAQAAQRIAGDAAAIREGDLVMVTGPLSQVALVEELVLAAQRRGAQTLQVLGRPQAMRRYYAEVPEKHDAASAAFSLKLAEIPTVILTLEAPEAPGLFQDVPASRLAAVSKAYREVEGTLLRRGVRQVTIGNGLFPNATQAKQLGLSEAELSRIFWAALATDPAAIRANGARVRGALAAGKEVRVTHANGTDLRLGVAGRTILVSDGTLDPAKIRPGEAGNAVWLPAGECFFSPVPGTATGTVVIDRAAFADGFIERLALTFKEGKLVAHTARPGAAYRRWVSLYEAAPAGKEAFAVFDIGLHPGAKPPRGKVLRSFIPAGAVTVGIGDDTWAGGSNATSFGFLGFVPGATVEVDGVVLVKKGELQAVR